MSTVVLSDMRHEIDENISRSLMIKQTNPGTGSLKSDDVKTRLRIRTLPRECNPTPALGDILSPSASGSLFSVSPMNKHINKNRRRDSIQLDNPFDDITEEKLRQLSKMSNLERVTSLHISIDSEKQSVEVIGELLPSLQQLHFQQSSLRSFRDLGTSLRSLRVLWAAQCQISNLDGIGALMNLQELYLQHNNVNDVSPLTMHDEIGIIDLEGNQMTEFRQIEQLAFCLQLRSLKLAGNPIETVKQYRQIVANFLPQLVKFDDKIVCDSERARLSESELDAIIQIKADKSISEAAKSLEEMPPDKNLKFFQYSSKTSPHDLRADDSGSRLTHGTDIVFAGNVSSALRRHRHEAEVDFSHRFCQSTRSFSHVSSGGGGYSRFFLNHEKYDRHETQAGRISITDTLDKAKELDTQKYKSRDALIEELKTWQLDSAVTSQVGICLVVEEAMSSEDITFNRSKSCRKNSIDIIAHSDPRVKSVPNSSYGVLRHGSLVREAFVDYARDFRPDLRSETNKQRDVDILAFGGSGGKRQCLPSETPRAKMFNCTKALGHHHDWNLEVLSPTVDLSNANRYLPTSLSRKQQLERFSVSHQKDVVRSGSIGSDADDDVYRLRLCPAILTKVVSPTLAPRKIFFNVVESLHAIEKWRDELDLNTNEEGLNLRAGLEEKCHVSCNNVELFQATSGARNQQTAQKKLGLLLGPGNRETDHNLVWRLRERHDQLRSREGFRSYFYGIEKKRLENVLRQAFDDQDKVHRRMQLMTGFFFHDSRGDVSLQRN
ncbi:putative leucine-rich repeat-containing protein [Plasmopara halstedii]